MNGLSQFDRNTVLVKDDNQYLNVSLYVNNQFDDELHHLSVRRLDTATINQQPIWQDQMDERVLVTRRTRPENVVKTAVAFQQRLVVDALQVEGDTLFGAKMQDVRVNMGMRKLLDEQTRGLQDLLKTVERATTDQQRQGEWNFALHVFW